LPRKLLTESTGRAGDENPRIVDRRHIDSL
jgi:hypothetical protein